MESFVGTPDGSVPSTSEKLTNLSLQSQKQIDVVDQECDVMSTRPGPLFEKYGSNEPYTEPELERDDTFGNRCLIVDYFALLEGPSTNFYVGPDEKHYTIPKRLLYRYTDYPRRCFEGHFMEASLNAVRLRDTDPDVFRWLWRWLFTGMLEVSKYFYEINNLSTEEELRQRCLLLCRLHVLGERLLFRWYFLSEVRQELVECIDSANSAGTSLPLTPDAMKEVLLHSAPVAPVPYGYVYSDFLLRYTALSLDRDFKFCTTTDFRDWIQCFELDGTLAAQLMDYMAEKLRWVRERWVEEIEPGVDITSKKQFALDHSIAILLAESDRERHGIWPVLRIMCTSAEYTREEFFALSPLWEADGQTAAEMLNLMAADLGRIVEEWAWFRDEEINMVAEEKEYERIEEEKDAWQSCLDKAHR